MRESPERDFWRNVRNELAAGRQWRNRAIVLTYAVITGLVVVAFALLADAASAAFDRLFRHAPYGAALTLLVTPTLTVAVLWVHAGASRRGLRIPAFRRWWQP